MTIVKWNDGTYTKVRCADDERYDQEKGLLAAMAKKLYEGTNLFVEELAYWCEDVDYWCEEPEEKVVVRPGPRKLTPEEWEDISDWLGHCD